MWTAHRIYRFEKDGDLYAADIDLGKVVKIDKVVWEILGLILGNDGKEGQIDRKEAKERLGDKFSDREIEEGLKKLRRFIDFGLFLSEIHPPSPISYERDEKLRLLVTYSVIGHGGIRTRLNHYYLLKSLSKKADLFISLPEGRFDALELEGVKVAPFRFGSSESQAKFVPRDCNGVLILSPLSGEDVMFFRYGDIPVITYIYSDLIDGMHSVNESLKRYAALRNYDLMAFDSSWTANFFRHLTRNNLFKVIPPGIDHDRFVPIRGAKRKLSKALGDPEVMRKALIGVELGWPKYKFTDFVLKLCYHNPDLIFLVFDPIWEEGALWFDLPENARGFGITTDKDIDISPLVFSSLDLFLFPAFPGASCTLLIEVMSCQVPVLAFGPWVPEEIEEGGDFIEISGFSSEFDDLLVQGLSLEIRRLLENTERRMDIGRKAREVASRFRWDRTADMMLELFRESIGRRMGQRVRADRRLLFARRYDKANDRLETRAFVMPYLFEQDLLRGLKETLSKEHTTAELEAIFMSLSNSTHYTSSHLGEL
jgi:glycosyltransferase involved in cell wall biosynthesis